jgi:antitoxin component YwqK of YwqJK toxin-antitoxin module
LLVYQCTNERGTKTYYYYTQDGKCYEAEVYRDGHVVEVVQDRNLDGIWDHWNYYEHGRIVRSKLDNNFDGKPDEFVTYSNGSPVTVEKDTDFNGTPDLFCTYKYGIIQEADMRPNGSKFTTEREVFSNGVLTEIWRGGDSNGNFSEVVRYDPFLNPISTNITTPFQLLTPSPMQR